jgi:hypothetical protein
LLVAVGRRTVHRIRVEFLEMAETRHAGQARGL